MLKRWIVAVVAVVVLMAVHWTATMEAILTTVPCWDLVFDNVDRLRAPPPCPDSARIGEDVTNVLLLPINALLAPGLVPVLGEHQMQVNGLVWALAIDGLILLPVRVRGWRTARFADDSPLSENRAMPKRPGKNPKRPADLNELAAMLVAEATAEPEPDPNALEKNPAAFALGRLGGLKGAGSAWPSSAPKNGQSWQSGRRRRGGGSS
jgi:hypothetical protein